MYEHLFKHSFTYVKNVKHIHSLKAWTGGITDREHATGGVYVNEACGAEHCGCPWANWNLRQVTSAAQGWAS